mmetsp:Transcript_27860/g.39194  ORF Transcript_27860/g.39194 Transcript_27860/m.39194 type:complete len:247 (-) Transcript_27860:245-985(-)
MICDHTVGHIDISFIFRTDLSAIRSGTSLLLNCLKDGNKNIRVIVRIDSLKDTGETFESHSCINMLGRQLSQTAIGLPIVLNKHIIPDFDHIWQIGIDKGGGITSTDTVVVDFSTRSTGSRSTHFPKVVGGIKGENTFSGKVLEPDIPSLKISWRRFVATKVGSIQTRCIKFELLSKAFPCHLNSTLLEVSTEGPVTKHLKEGVMVHIFSDIIKIIVLSTGTDTFLRIDGAGKLTHLKVGVTCSKK